MWMVGAVLSTCASSGNGAWTCELRKNDKMSHIVWNARGDTMLSIPADWHANYANTLTGDRVEIKGNSIFVGVQPVLIQ
jgi:hypothetical protein